MRWWPEKCNNGRRHSLLLIFLFATFLHGVAQPLPESPEILYVTIDLASGRPVIRWQHPNFADIDSFTVKRLIYRTDWPALVSETAYLNIEETGKDILTYTDLSTRYGSADPLLRQLTYRIGAYRAQGGGNIYSLPSAAHSPVFLKPVNSDPCTGLHQLSWSPYKGLIITGYHVYAYSDVNPAPQLIASTGAADTTFAWQPPPGPAYTCYVAAVTDTGEFSYSNKRTGLTADPPAGPLFINADFATVNSSAYLEVSFSLGALNDADRLLLLHGLHPDSLTDTLSVIVSASSSISYTDSLANITSVHYYQLAARHAGCNISFGLSNLAANMVCSVVNGPSATEHRICWSPYTFWKGATDGYTLYRSFANGPFEEIASLSYADTCFDYDISSYTTQQPEEPAGNGQLCYYVEARETSANPHGITGHSVSNTICYALEPVVYVPNTINPLSRNEINRYFRPVMFYTSDFRMRIYSRAGELLYESLDQNKGWDGRGLHGELVPEGTYLYVLTYRSGSGKPGEKTGSVTVLYF